MEMTHPVADMPTRSRNANVGKHDTPQSPAPIVKAETADIPTREAYIRGYEVVADNKQGVLRLFLKYGQNEERVITGLKRISKPGRRVYAKAHEVPRVLNGLGTAVVSTSNGV